MGSVIGLGGVLKNFIVPNALPVGSLVGAAGHEVYDFSKYPEYKNKQAYCYQSLDFAIDANLLGFYFGGEASKVITTGSCDMKPEALVGEDLMVFISIDPGKGTKSLPIGVAFNFGFNMDNYVSQMKRSFVRSYLSDRSSGQRLRRLHLHIAGYLAQKSIGAVLTARERLFAKLMLFPYLAQYTDEENVLKLVTPTTSELGLLKKISKNGFKFSIKDTLKSFYHKARKDAGFYYCKDYRKCEEKYVDFLGFYSILIDSFDDCGSMNIYAGAISEFSIKMTGKLKVEVGFGYTRTEFNKAYNSKYPTSWQALKQFASHNFIDQSKECEELPEKVGSNFADFLNFLY